MEGCLSSKLKMSCWSTWYIFFFSSRRRHTRFRNVTGVQTCALPIYLWLNHPLRPLEASGTSGMKSAPNGGINLSVLDGWWREGFNGSNGWGIGAEIDDGTTEFQNDVDASSLYQLLENQIVPLYYAKPDGKLPLA